jgi:DNA primase
LSLSPQFLDELRARTTLSALIGASIKVEKAGREFKACCPFHQEKSPSFTINDEKGFYHCFGCGAHGDAIRWMTDQRGLPFIDAVRELAAAAGLEVPARSPEDAQRAERREAAADVLDQAAAWYRGQLGEHAAVQKMLADRGVDHELAMRFGIGFAPANRSVSACGAGAEVLTEAGLLVKTDDGLRERFRGRIIIPIHDQRGRTIGFGARATREGQEPKYLNSAEGGSATFDKGRTLFNLHRAAPAARTARRLIIVEGYFDVIALASVGIAEAVAPMGTAITEAQLERAWRVIERPVLLFDGDGPGRRAAHRAGLRALPLIGPGRSLSIALLPEGKDPDELVRADGAAAIEAVLADGQTLDRFLWDVEFAAADHATPEGRSALKARLDAMAGEIADDETRAQYRAVWRERYDATFPLLALGADDEAMLPDGRERFKDQPEAVRARLTAVGTAWLEREVARVAARMGHDPDALKKFAYRFGCRVGEGVIDTALLWKPRRWPEGFADPEGYAALEKSVQAGERRGFDIGPMLVMLRCASLPLTDFGIAERFNIRFGDQFRFTTAKGWLGWDTRRWAVLDQEKDSPPAEIIAAVWRTVRAVQDEAKAIEATGQGKHGLDFAYLKGKQLRWHHQDVALFGRQSETSGKPNAIQGLARRWLTVPIERFDCDPDSINVLNGTLRFTRTVDGDGRRRARVTLEPHDRADLNTRLAPVLFDPGADSPVYDGFLSWAQPDAPVRRYLHQWGGYSLSGHVSEQMLQFWYGKGANGKSTLIDIWAHVAGDYAGTIGIETFLDQGIKKRGEQASPDLARLGGVRLLRASEPERGARLNEALIKAATGGEPMAVRALHRGFFDLRPLFKLTIGGNYRPDIPGTDEGIWRRMKLIPWDQYRALHERDEALPGKLRAEASGILNHLVAGLVDWIENGMVEPDSVTKATDDYRKDSDPLGRFLSLCTVHEAGSRVQSSVLHDLFCAWAQAAGEKPWSNKGLSKALTDKGFRKIASDGMHWLDLKMVRVPADFVDKDGHVVELQEAPSARDGPPAPAAPPDDDDFVPGFD